jgi:hypothetical protein
MRVTSARERGRKVLLRKLTDASAGTADEITARCHRCGARRHGAPFLYRNQADDCGLAVHKISERAFHRAEGANDLLHDTEGDDAIHQRCRVAYSRIGQSDEDNW